MKKRLFNFLNRLKSKIPRKFRWRLPFFYALGLILGLLLILIYGLVPSFSICSKLFGEEFCTPTGVYLIMILNLPGYFIVGNLLPFLERANWIISMALVLLTSAVFYLFVGMLLDKYRSADRDRKIIILVVTFFFILLFLLLLFLF